MAARSITRPRTSCGSGSTKKTTGKPTITWQEAVDEALCFGWIDGIRKSVDADSYTNRFTPRRRGSFLECVNTRRAAELLKAGRMRAAGRAAFDARDTKRTEALNRARSLPRLERSFRRNSRQIRPAWAVLCRAAAWLSRMAIWFVMSDRRMRRERSASGQLVAISASKRRLVPMARCVEERLKSFTFSLLRSNWSPLSHLLIVCRITPLSSTGTFQGER
jgi:hypothetical protein